MQSIIPKLTKENAAVYNINILFDDEIETKDGTRKATNDNTQGSKIPKVFISKQLSTYFEVI